MDKQKVFDKVVNHLLTQNAQSIQKFDECDFACMYRGPNGLMCAVGCLITDEAYTYEVECNIMGSHSVNQALELSGIEVDETDEHILRDLQILHDACELYDKIYDVAHWPEGLKKIANHYGLKYNGLTV